MGEAADAAPPYSRPTDDLQVWTHQPHHAATAIDTLATQPPLHLCAALLASCQGTCPVLAAECRHQLTPAHPQPSLGVRGVLATWQVDPAAAGGSAAVAAQLLVARKAVVIGQLLAWACMKEWEGRRGRCRRGDSHQWVGSRT